MKKLLLIALVSAFAALPVLAVTPPTVSADDGEDHSAVPAETATEENSEEATENTAGTYDYVAQPGDSYHVLARKAIQTFGLETETNLSGAQIIFAETMLAQEADSPVLNEGQSVSISKSAVQKWVEKAQALSEADEAAWDYYVQFVDFDTSDNGEA